MSWNSTLDGYLSDYQRTVRSLAALPVFTAPSDYSEYRRRLQQVTASEERLVPAEVRRLARIGGYARLTRGHLYRGMPLVGDRGRGLLLAQRQMAAYLLRGGPTFLESVAEIDSLGRFVFVEPYNKQLAIQYFDIGRSSFFFEVRRQPGRWMVHESFDNSKRQLLSFASAIRRAGGVDGYLILSIGLEDFASELSAQAALPPQVLGVVMREGFRGSEIAGIKRSFKQQGAIQRLLLTHLSTWSASWVLQRDRSPTTVGGLTCHLRFDQKDYPTVLECTDAVGGGSLKTTTSASVELTDVTLANTLLAAFALLCILPPVFTLFGTQLFGKRWAIVGLEKDRLVPNLVSAADNLAHDFRSIVQSLRDEVRLLRAALILPEPIARLSRTITQFELATDNLRSNLISQIGGDESQAKVELFLPFVVRNAIEYQRPRHREAKIEARFVDGGDLCFVRAHLGDLNRLLGNLIDNAVEASSSTSHRDVVVEVAAAESLVRIRVIDQGEGIRQSDFKKVFDAEFSTKGTGRGKGLASSRRIVEDLAGRITVESSEIGKGTIVLVELPSVPCPPWFMAKVVVRPDDVLVFVDDEEEMQEVWRNRMASRFKKLEVENGLSFAPRLEFVSEPSDLHSSKKQLLSEGTRFFVDFRLKNYQIDGLSLIQEFNLRDRAVLVTNHFHDPSILRRAVEIGVPVLPKEFLFEVSFNLEMGGPSDE
jgi:signal transduction histidine kinase